VREAFEKAEEEVDKKTEEEKDADGGNGGIRGWFLA
jgi:hypothetical protein